MTQYFNKDERNCIYKLADFFGKSQPLWRMPPCEWSMISLTKANSLPILSMMESLGIIQHGVHMDGNPYVEFQITAKVLHYARQIEEQEKKNQERKDIVEMVKETFKKHPKLAWVTVTVLGIMFIATAITQVGGALKMVGILPK